jgi:hypothetical protein
MSAIFKTRKIPRHLVIEAVPVQRPASRWRPWGLLLWLLCLLALTVAALGLWPLA